SRITRRIRWKTHVHRQRGSSRAMRLRICIALTVRDEGKGIRTIRIDPELVSERTSLDQLNRNETKIAATIAFAHEMQAILQPRPQAAQYPIQDAGAFSFVTLGVAQLEGAADGATLETFQRWLVYAARFFAPGRSNRSRRS